MNVKKAQYRIALISLFFVPLLLVLTTTAVAAASVSLRWDPNDPAPEGYRVFARISHKVYNYNQPDWEGAADLYHRQSRRSDGVLLRGPGL